MVEFPLTSDDADALDFVTAGLPVDDEVLPDAFAPMVRNAWYVIAEIKDVGRELRGIKVLGEPLVMFRSEAGEPVVLDDRCAHRRFPLSRSKLIGDTIQCGYHGFTFSATGRCIWAPAVFVKPGVGIRRYPCAEVGPWVWAWMGDPTKADPATIPYPKLSPAETWHVVEGYKHNPGNYCLLIENLLDLTHLHFLHGPHVSTLEEANVPPKALPPAPGAVGWIKETPLAKAGLFAGLVGGSPEDDVRVTTMSVQTGPSINHGWEERRLASGEDSPIYPLRFEVRHAITPEDLNNTHQFFQSGFNRLPVIPMEAFADMSRDVVFEQDADAIGRMQSAIANDRRSGPLEVGIPGDRFGMKMRQLLRQMKQAETVAAAE